MASINKGTVLGEHVLFCLYLIFHWRDCPEHFHLALYTHALEATQVWLLSGAN